MRKLLFSAVFSLFLILPGISDAAVATPLLQCGETASFVPYVYEDGKLHSFDMFFSATGTPLVYGVSVGGVDLDTRYATVWKNGEGTKVHVDVPAWIPLYGSIEATVGVSRETCGTLATFPVHLPTKPVKPVSQAPVATVPQAPVQEVPATTPETPVQAEAGHGQLGIGLVCTAGEAALSWSKVGATESYVVDRKLDEEQFAALGVVSGETLSYTDTEVEPGKTHAYRVRAFNGSEFIATSDVATCDANSIGQGAVPAATQGQGGQCRIPPFISAGGIVLLLIASIATIFYRRYLLEGNGWRFTVALFVPFALLLGAWFVVDECRWYQWFPIAVTLITLITLFIPTFWNGKVVVE